ncbi:MAG: hypothetical protein NVS3B25_01700 [Hymenobacter sp.]
MQALRTPVALLFLLCLTRTMLPEAWILALHSHAHTTAEPAQAPAFVRKGPPLLSAKHQHCAVEQFYNVAFWVGPPVPMPEPAAAPPYAGAVPPLAVRTAAGQLVRPLALRGPPALV